MTELPDDMECFIWCAGFVETGSREQADAWLEQFRSNPAFYLAVVYRQMQVKALPDYPADLSVDS